MARHTRTVDSAAGEQTYTDEVRTADSSGIDLAARLVALVAAAIPTIIGLLALAKIDWSNGLDSPATTVAEMNFRPWVAIGTVAIGVIGLLAAASSSREGKLAVGAIMACGGVVILLANPKVQQLAMNDRLGWMFALVGLVMIVAGLLAGRRYAVRREVHADGIDIR